MTGVSLEQIEAGEVLSDEERERLAELEGAIEQGVRSFAEIGRALRAVREARLYRETHGTFEAYCRDRWDISPQHAGRLIAAAEVVAAVEPIGSIPATESQARELAPLLDEPEKLTRVWESATTAAAAAERPVTAADVREARRQLEPAPVAPAPPVAAAPVLADDDEDAASDLRFAHIEEGVQVLRMLPSPDRIVWPTDPGDLEAVGEAIDWLAKFTPQLARAWREHKRSHRRLRVV